MSCFIAFLRISRDTLSYGLNRNKGRKGGNKRLQEEWITSQTQDKWPKASQHLSIQTKDDHERCIHQWPSEEEEGWGSSFSTWEPSRSIRLSFFQLWNMKQTVIIHMVLNLGSCWTSKCRSRGFRLLPMGFKTFHPFLPRRWFCLSCKSLPFSSLSLS